MIMQAEQSYYLDDICAFGLPSVENVVIRRPYVSSVNFRTKCPNWVAEHYTNLNTEDSHDLSPSKISRKGIEFKGDVALPKPFRALPADYVNTGYSRGHLATAASHNRRDLDLLETFLLTSNIVPQDNTMNEGDWAKLENLTRQLCKHYSHVRTITGPLYLPTMHEGRQVVQYDVLGKNQIHIPTHLFKVVYLTGPMKPLSGDAVVAKGATNFRVPNTQPLTLQQLQQPPTPAMTSPRHYGDTTVSVIAFAMPNNAESVDNPMSSYVIPLAAIERASGLCLTPRGTPNSITMTTSIRD
jgi:DNA/RNA endonuclease G (NUC1)